MLRTQNKNYLFSPYLAWIIIFNCIMCNAPYAAKKQLPLPRFASIKSNEVNARKGPGVSYPIEWVYIKKGEPIEIIAEFEQWRKVQDINKNGGWIHSSVLSGRRSCINNSSQPISMHYRASQESVVIAKILPNVRCSIKKCNKLWCKLICQNYTGWVSRKYSLWGIYEHEEKIK